MAENDQEKTEDPTPKRRSEARDDGQVARSQDLTAAVTLLAAVLALYAFGLNTYVGLKRLLAWTLSDAGVQAGAGAGELLEFARQSGRLLAGSTIPLLLTLIGATLIVSVYQVGLKVSAKPLQPKPDKLSPLKGLKNMFGAQAGVKFLMSLGKLGIVAGIAAIVIGTELPQIAALAQLDAVSILAAGSERVWALALKLAAAMIVLGVADYVWQVWKHEQDLKMSKQEVKDEMKKMEGDPTNRQRRFRVARQLAMQRVSSAVPTADVVVTNPTHFAVAIRYDADRMGAPRVAAKGADLVAMRIRQLATTHGVPIVERKPLARALYRQVEVGQEVPPEHYQAVAEILAYVYRLSGKQPA